MIKFNATTVVIDLLEELGYKNRPIVALEIANSLDYKEYQVTPTHIRYRLPYGSYGHKRFGILRIKGYIIHVHGSEVDCTYINLADPGSLSTLRSILVSAEKPNGNPGRS